MKVIILLFLPTFGFAQRRDTVPEKIYYKDMTIKSTSGYSFRDANGNKVFLSSTKKTLNANFVVINDPVVNINSATSDTLVSGYGIIIDSLSQHKFSIRIDTSWKKQN